MARLDPNNDPPRAFVGDLQTRLIHRTDSEDEACFLTGDDDRYIVYSDHLDKLLAQEWSGYTFAMGPFLEGEKPEDYGLPEDAKERKHATEVMRRFRLCVFCKPEASE